MIEIDYNQIFNKRYNRLNEAQRAAVDHIDGPLMVVAGPGTGKTELLTMRTANILRMTDVLPSNILCLTFTEAAATNMTERLNEIVGPTAYQIEISTFHGFGVNVRNRYAEYFDDNPDAKAADELTQGEIIDAILAKLPYDNPLGSKINGKFNYRKSILRLISDLKRADISPEELRAQCEQNIEFCERLEPSLNELTAIPLRKKTDRDKALNVASDLAVEAARIASEQADLDFTDEPKLGNMVARSLADALAECEMSGKTSPLTAWKGRWTRHDERGDVVTATLADKARSKKLLLAANVYENYLTTMRERGLYDFGDMIMNVIAAIERHPALKADLRERYQYVMVDEFQDTNDAQMKILRLLTDYDDEPNLMVVGDDDQAIYRFQGADISNILNFAKRFPTLTQINLTENYRSGAEILVESETVAMGIGERLTNVDGTAKRLNAARASELPTDLRWVEVKTANQECDYIAELVADEIKRGQNPAEIAVIARNHKSLVRLVPFLAAHGVAVSYDRGQNVFDSPIVRLILNLAGLIHAMYTGADSDIDGYLPEVLADPCFGVTPAEFYNLGEECGRRARRWLDNLDEKEEHHPLVEWLRQMAVMDNALPLVRMLDELIGLPPKKDMDNDDEEPASARNDVAYHSPIYDAYFALDKLDNAPRRYLEFLDDLNKLLATLRQYQPDRELKLPDLLDFWGKCQELDVRIYAPSHGDDQAAVRLMSAHGSKGLEFETVVIMDAENNVWGSEARGAAGNLALASNMPYGTVAGTDDDERRRLLYVAMTRAKRQLIITSHQTDNDKKLAPVSYLDADFPNRIELPEPTEERQIEELETSIFQRVKLSQEDRERLLAPRIKDYRLTATDLNTFIDVVNGGPEEFVTRSLLHVPERTTAALTMGNAMHETLQQLHEMVNKGETIELDVAARLFEKQFDAVADQIDPAEAEKNRAKGLDSIRAYLAAKGDSFIKGQQAERPLNAVTPEGIGLNGKLDCLTINHADNTIAVVDYKTGQPLHDLREVGGDDNLRQKARRYKQQLLFYKLLVENNGEFKNYRVTSGELDFIQPDPKDGRIYTPAIDYADKSEALTFYQLVSKVWSLIQRQIWPDISGYPKKYKGIVQFEQDIIEGKFD